MKKKNIIKLLISILLVCISTIVYSSTFGNPISYLKAKKEINSYIDKNYSKELEIEKVFYSFKTNGYSSIVVDRNDSRLSSYIEYYKTGYINDGYQFEVRMNIEDQVRDILESLISQGTNLTRLNMGIEASIDLEEFKYDLNDRYSGKEPIDLQIWVHSPILYEEKSNQNKEVVLYKNEDDFSNDVYDIMKVLKSTKYNFNSIEIYSYREDGNSNYRFKSNNKEELKSVEDIKNNVFIAEGEKEAEIKLD